MNSKHTKKWKGVNYFHYEDDIFTSKEEAIIHANWLKSHHLPEFSHISSTKVTKEDDGTYWVWHH